MCRIPLTCNSDLQLFALIYGRLLLLLNVNTFKMYVLQTIAWFILIIYLALFKKKRVATAIYQQYIASSFLSSIKNIYICGTLKKKITTNPA